VALAPSTPGCIRCPEQKVQLRADGMRSPLAAFSRTAAESSCAQLTCLRSGVRSTGAFACFACICVYLRLEILMRPTALRARGGRRFQESPDGSRHMAARGHVGVARILVSNRLARRRGAVIRQDLLPSRAMRLASAASALSASNKNERNRLSAAIVRT
jgi:hypothetical protein